ncbi:DUF6930 domain-containing protein [Almyronema epifaneia]|uniref:DUF6930 domain-containing protein n=1 Tax=Almyronema epifaneia S1 TaxID=2991925 RepID=A0ABW6IH87_9CYAN
MSSLNRFTSRRINRLPKLPGVWEGDRRRLEVGALAEEHEMAEASGEGDCILWVDGTQGVVRSISVVPAETGHEAVVRALLQAIERPQGPAEPGRPQKIVVRDREIHFFLRGALQELDIEIDYVPSLPLIDEIFSGLMQYVQQSTPKLPEAYAERLIDKAHQIWQDAPWHVLNEQQIIALEINRWDIQTLYVSVLGMAGVEYGLLMYRSLESLKQFRQRVLSVQGSSKQLQQAFLEQDCLFVNFELIEDDDEVEMPPSMAQFSALWKGMAPSAVEPEFGSLHPLEGLRSTLAVEEAATTIVALEAFHRFLAKHYRTLEKSLFPAMSGQYRIPNPEENAKPATVTITVRTLPEVATELTQETERAERSGELRLDAGEPILRDDYVPEGAIIILRPLPHAWIDTLTQHPKTYHQPSLEAEEPLSAIAVEIPVVLIQTSRPKAQALIHDLKQAGGIRSVCFNQGNDPISDQQYDLGLLQTGDGEFHLFGEFLKGDKTDERRLKAWRQWQKDSQGRCGVVIAAGVTGAARGQPEPKHLMALFEARSRSPEELNLRPLQLQFAVDWEVDF